jgi:hypothetical protein
LPISGCNPGFSAKGKERTVWRKLFITSKAKTVTFPNNKTTKKSKTFPESLSSSQTMLLFPILKCQHYFEMGIKLEF